MLIPIIIEIIILIYFFYYWKRQNELVNFIYYKLNPSNAKYKNFYKLCKANDETEIYLLGTIHEQHFYSKGYSLHHLQALIENLKPDIVLLELRPEALEIGNCDASIEMTFAYCISQKYKITCRGIDWWNYDLVEQSKLLGTPRDDMIFKNIVQNIDGQYKKVLVLLGYSHIYYQIERFKSINFNKSILTKKQKIALFNYSNVSFIVPSMYTEYLKNWVCIHFFKQLELTQGYPSINSCLYGAKDRLIKIIKEFEDSRIGI